MTSFRKFGGRPVISEGSSITRRVARLLLLFGLCAASFMAGRWDGMHGAGSGFADRQLNCNSRSTE
jgi:hypothetical protein